MKAGLVFCIQVVEFRLSRRKRDKINIAEISLPGIINSMKYKSFLVFILLVLPSMALAAGFERDLYFGLKNDQDVKSLQEFLRDQSLYSGPVNGNFFSLTREAVKKFQTQEKISPAVGYFGVKTRARANLLFSQKPAVVSKGSLIAQIQALQVQLQALQEKLVQEQASSSAATTTAVSTDVDPPAFLKVPKVKEAGFLSGSSFPFGTRYPYRVVLDWEHDEKNPQESVDCVPLLKKEDKTPLRLTQYFPEARTNYICTVAIKDQAENKAAADVLISSPSWVSVSGQATSTFPAIEAAFFKLGEFKVYNGSSSDVLFANFETEIVDEMDSVFNRNRKVNFLLRDGVQSIDTLISSTEFTFILTAPEIGKPHISPLNLAFGVKLKPGEEKTVSFWIEQMKYVRSGTLQIRSTKTVMVTDGTSATGKWSFALTREPPL